jgi:hypothetical protein
MTRPASTLLARRRNPCPRERPSNAHAGGGGEEHRRARRRASSCVKRSITSGKDGMARALRSRLWPSASRRRDGPGCACRVAGSALARAPARTTLVRVLLAARRLGLPRAVRPRVGRPAGSRCGGPGPHCGRCGANGVRRYRSAGSPVSRAEPLAGAVPQSARRRRGKRFARRGRWSGGRRRGRPLGRARASAESRGSTGSG